MTIYLILWLLVWCRREGAAGGGLEVDVKKVEKLRWPRGVVHYALSPRFSEKQRCLIRKAMDIIEKKTCVTFRPRLSAHKHKHPPVKTLYLRRGPGCSSRVGYIPSGSMTELHDRCFVKFGSVIHELLHVLGLRHEHRRFDRNSYVFVNRSNILRPFRKNFYRLKRRKSYITSAGLPYDYGSIMHYSKFGFTKWNDVPTMLPIVPCADIGQRVKMSAADVARINRLYVCRDKYLGDDIVGATPFEEWQRRVAKLRRQEARSRW